MMKAPITTPTTLPTPPDAEAPPMNTAAITSSSNPVPPRGVALLRRATKISPATAASTPILTKAKKVTREVLIPDSLAALRLPPTA
ncbi:hypothetical protein D3C76_1412290 [compost metagenome]